MATMPFAITKCAGKALLISRMLAADPFQHSSGLVEQVCAEVGNLAGLDLGGPFSGFAATHFPEILNESEVLEDRSRVASF